MDQFLGMVTASIAPRDTKKLKRLYMKLQETQYVADSTWLYEKINERLS